MRAIIRMRLAERDNLGSLVEEHHETFRKDGVEQEVVCINRWIDNRMFNERMTHVFEFHVLIKSHRGVVVREWKYRPTYR